MSDFTIGAHTMLALLSIEGIGKKTAIKIAKQCDRTFIDPKTFYDSVIEFGGKQVERKTKSECEEALGVANRILDSLDSQDINVLSLFSDEFPLSLKTIPDPPPILFVRGSVSSLHMKSVAIIGTRNASEFALKSAFLIATKCAQNSLGVVSGLATGCDTEAHKGCIVGKQPTVATLAHGLHHLYPPENVHLANEIVESGGALISEYLPDTPPHSERFIERDRLQSGLSKGLILVESSIRGGSMHTVRFAVKQNRLIATMLPQDENHFGPHNEGNQSIAGDKTATALHTSEDLIAFLAKLEMYDFEKEPDTLREQ